MSEKIYIKRVAETVQAKVTDQELDKVIRAHLDSWGYEHVTVEQWRRDNYQMLRQWAYPPIEVYLDSQVKVKRGIYGAGKRQEDDYFDACWAVKERFPK